MSDDPNPPRVYVDRRKATQAEVAPPAAPDGFLIPRSVFFGALSATVVMIGSASWYMATSAERFNEFARSVDARLVDISADAKAAREASTLMNNRLTRIEAQLQYQFKTTEPTAPVR